MASQIILPKLTYEMQEGCILEWLCSEGEAVSKHQPLFVVETDKAAIEVPAEEPGTLLKILVQAGSTVPVNTPVAWIGGPGEAMPGGETAQPVEELAAPVEEKPRVVVPPEEPKAVRTSPGARRLARELGVDLKAVQEQVRPKPIREADVQAYADAQARAMPATPVAKRVAVEFELIQPTPLQRAMATRLTKSAAIPQYAAACDVDLTNLEQFRSSLLSDWEASRGFRLTHTHILAALVAQALESCPTLNASWTDEGIRLYRTVNLGVAMATERGLVVPVVQRANQLSLEEVAAEIVKLHQAANRNRLLPQDLEGGTFTLTNVGMMGITLSIPVLNPPQSGILAVGAEREHLILQDGELRSIPVTTITLVADHRVVDGATGAQFLGRVKNLMENPWLAFLSKEGSVSAPANN